MMNTMIAQAVRVSCWARARSAAVGGCDTPRTHRRARHSSSRWRWRSILTDPLQSGLERVFPSPRPAVSTHLERRGGRSLCEGRVAFSRATPLLAGEPVFAGGADSSMRIFFADFATDVHGIVGARKTFVTDLGGRAWTGALYFLADLTPAPYPFDRETTTINAELRAAVVDHIRAHIRPTTSALIGTSLQDPAAVAVFLETHPGAVKPNACFRRRAPRAPDGAHSPWPTRRGDPPRDTSSMTRIAVVISSSRIRLRCSKKLLRATRRVIRHFRPAGQRACVLDADARQETAHLTRALGATIVQQHGQGYGALDQDRRSKSRARRRIVAHGDGVHPPGAGSAPVRHALIRAIRVIASRYVSQGFARCRGGGRRSVAY